MSKNLKPKLQRLKFNIDVTGALKRHIIIILLVLFTAVTRVLLIINAPFIYHFDSYTYLGRAVDLASNGTIQLGVGMPFVLTLAALLFTFGSSFGSILIARFLMLLATAVSVCVIYLLGVKMASKTFGFLAAFLATFEPYFLTYSIVPHNDVFAVAMGLAALYLAASSVRFHYALAPIFFYFAILTRPEFFLVLVIPILAFSIAKVLKMRSKRAIRKFAFDLGVYVLPFIWVYSVSKSYTRFNPFEKFALFLKPELLQFTLDSVFKFYDKEFLNQVFFVFFAMGVGATLLTTAAQFVSVERKGKAFSIKRKKDKSVKEIFLSDKAIVTLCVFLLFIIDVIVLTVYGMGYAIVNGTLIIKPWFPDRYLILPRLLTSYPLAYTLSMVVQSFRAQISSQK